MNKPKLKNKNERGITLVALVITIIVLLILAGVAINMAINSDGLFGKANEATEGLNTAVEQEQTAIQELLNELGIFGGGEDPVTLPAGWDSNKIASTVKETSTITGTEKERIVPIPKGFEASQIGGTTPENTIAGGLVIYQIPEGATVDWEASTITIGENTTNLQETVNQFVWIPVDDVNQMVMCKSNNSTGTVTEENTSDVCNVKLVNGVLQCTNSAHTANATNLCGRLYSTDSITTDTSTPKTYTTSMNFADRTQTWSDDKEPDIITGNSSGTGTSYDGVDSNLTEIGLSATDDLTVQKVFLEQLTSDFTVMATSVAKYGGFYVSRYEAGVNGASKKNQVVITASNSNGTNYVGVNKWYGLYNAVKSSTALGETVVSTHMIYGSQYDQIINFIGSEAQTGHPGSVVTSQSLTGTKPEDRLNNIYDLEGNNREWTAQADIPISRVLRGGIFQSANFGGFYPASERGTNTPTGTLSDCTTRSSLYL